MAKIICDVCGTSYPETATQCPICGCVRSAHVRTMHSSEDTPETERTGSYTYVKGGRFSKANVEKRNRGIPVETEKVVHSGSSDNEPKKDKNSKDTAFIITIAVLLVAILAVIAYIVFRYISPVEETDDETLITTVATQSATEESTDPTTETTTAPTETTPLLVPCTSITLDEEQFEFTEIGQTKQLTFVIAPEDTTDEVVFSSLNDTIASVSEDGLVTAVSNGETAIIVSCGEFSAEFTAICKIEPEETEPEYDASKLKFTNYIFTKEDPKVGDVTQSRSQPWNSYDENKCGIPASVITFTSSDTSVATVDENGRVTALKAGTTIITAEYGGVTIRCKVTFI